MPIDPIETLWINAQRTNTADGAKVSQSEADAIIYAVTGDGKITNAEVAVIDEILRRAGAVAESAHADAELDAMDLGMSGANERDRARTAAREGTLTRADVAGMTGDLLGLTNDGRASSHDDAHRAHLLKQATHIRHQIEIARHVPTMVDKLSYGAFDWKIFDSEAKAALGELETSAKSGYANVVINNLGGKFLKRLADQLPTDGKARLWKVVEGLDSTTRSYVHKTLGRGLWNELQKAR